MKANDRFRAASQALDFYPDIQYFPEGTRTAADAANAVGCSIGQIVKSLVFAADEQPVLLLVSGSNRVDEKLVENFLNATSLSIAAPDEVKEATGFAIGGTPPFGHNQQIQTIMDSDLNQYDQVWAAAGTPDSCFPISPTELCKIANATVADISETYEETFG